MSCMARGRKNSVSSEQMVELERKFQIFLETAYHKEYLIKHSSKFNISALINIGKEKISINSKNKQKGFESIMSFCDWWMNCWNKQAGACIYCETKFSDLDKVIESGKLKQSVRGNRIRGGRFPEIERINSEDKSNVYSSENCALVCYYCNNDKSNVYINEHYKKYLAPAKREYIKILLGEN